MSGLAEYASIGSPPCPVIVTVSASTASYMGQSLLHATCLLRGSAESSHHAVSNAKQPGEPITRLGDHELVPITEADYDLNVSGSVSPFERPGLGPWLQDDRLDKWDGLCVAKLDRLTRSLSDFVTLVSWLEARGKTLICIDPMLDLSTPAGRAFASITATFAQFERETIAARVSDAWHKLRDSGKYGGGQVPFGYRPVKLGRGWGYEPDPVYGPIVAEMFDRYSRFESLGSITRWLNETGVPTPWNVTRIRNGKKPPKDAIWKMTSVRKILASPAMLGATIKTDGTPVRDEDGMVMYRADELVKRDVWERVQARLAANPVSAKVQHLAPDADRILRRL